MVESLYSPEDDLLRAHFGLLRLYLTTSDCLVQHGGDPSRDTSVTVRVCRDQESCVPYPAADAAWVPDFLCFKDLNEFPREGQEFVIIPQYISNSTFRSAHFPTNVTYHIESKSTSLSWLSWDDRIAGFKGIIPMYSEVQWHAGYFGSVRSSYCNPTSSAPVDKICMDVKAVLTNDNGSLVRYERVVRARLTLGVFPWNISSNHHDFSASKQFGPHSIKQTPKDPGFGQTPSYPSKSC